jgi:tRNA(adenine34) deaminase
MADYAAKVKEQVERLQSRSYGEIEAAVAQKRITWWQREGARFKTAQAPTPRQAFERLFLDYMHLSLEDLPILHESEDEIAWLSKNPCPTLDACIELGRDPRQVCRAAYEKSTQAFVSQLDPQLRFLRSYEEIRPYAPHCLERIVRVDFVQMMKVAIEEAKRSRQEGNKGYGAVVAFGNQILAQAHDTAATAADPSLHAEVNALREAVRGRGEANLSGAILVSTCEPCPMCSSLAVWANVTSIVYGASIEETARLGKARIRVGAKEIVEKSPVMVEVIEGVLRSECLDLYR